RLKSFFETNSPNVAVNLLPDKTEHLLNQTELQGAKILSDTCAEFGVPLIQLSSYASFGTDYATEAIKEDLAPCDVKADSKDTLGTFYRDLEQIAAQHAQHMLLRLPWKLDFGDDCLLAKTIPNLIYGEALKVSSYCCGSVVTKKFLAQVLSACIKQILCGAENWGAFNFRNSEYFSEAEFVDALSRLLEQEFTIQVNTPELYSEAGQPRLMSGSANLEAQRLTNNFGILFPAWRVGFKNTARTWMQTQGFEVLEEKKLSS
ncbi:MAG: NAD(P)-dependent oxidoreductase, partial [Cellvibrionaceae bacterium]|nr:NAD(P)-dependent oxidoreductase [Cellvibrionaceae bacterium]